MLNGTEIYLGHISTAILHIIVCLALGFCIPICLPSLMLAISWESKSISAVSWMFISMKESVMRRERGWAVGKQGLQLVGKPGICWNSWEMVWPALTHVLPMQLHTNTCSMGSLGGWYLLKMNSLWNRSGNTALWKDCGETRGQLLGRYITDAPLEMGDLLLKSRLACL